MNSIVVIHIVVILHLNKFLRKIGFAGSVKIEEGTKEEIITEQIQIEIETNKEIMKMLEEQEGDELQQIFKS